MEADTDDKRVSNPTKAPVNTTVSSKSVAISQSLTASPRNMTLPLSSSENSMCSTPLLHDMENDFLKQQHTLHTYDSGFSDWTPGSDPSVASLGETPNLLHGASFSAQRTSSVELESDSAEFFQRHHRRSWPLRTRKLSFQSPDSDGHTLPDSPMSHMRLVQDKYCALNNTNNSNSTPFHSEEVRLILSKSNIAKHGPVRQFLERSRSFSRSPLSSASDDLEGSFQEMSLEENSSLSSSSSNEPSPTPLTSSSPVFSFSFQNKSNSASTSFIAKSERKLSHLSWENTQAHSDFDIQDDFSSAANSNTLINSLSCQKLSNDDDLSSLQFCSGTDRHLDKHVSQHSSSSTALFHEDKPSKDSPSIVIVSPLPFPNVLSSHCQRHCSSSHPCSTCRNNDYSSFTSVNIDNCIKSPIKRTCDIPHPSSSSTESVSPQKIRKLRLPDKKSSYSCNFKRDLSSFQCSVQTNTKTEPVQSYNYEKDAAQQRAMLRSVDERIPQFLHIGSELHDTSPTKTLVTPVSRWKVSNHRNFKIVKSKERSKEVDEGLIDRVCLKFSPAVPSQLIGRNVGVKKFDILGELQQRSFIQFIEVILAYIPDCDLLKFVEVSSDWKSALFAEPKAHRRYKALCKKMSPRKLRNQAGKENMGKHLDRENVSMTTSKGHLTTIQPQFVVTDSSVPSSIPQRSELLSEDITRNCPHCQCRAVVQPSQDRAICMSDRCAYDFCTKCFFSFHHPSPCKPLFNCASKTMLTGSKKSKRNLKRLKNL